MAEVLLSLQRNGQGKPTRFVLGADGHYDTILYNVTRGVANYNFRTKEWRMAPDPLFYRNLKQYIPEFKETPDVTKFMHELKCRRDELANAIKNGSPIEENDKLWGHTQRSSVRFLLAGQRVILAHDMGIGKTVIACSALKYANVKRVIVICPDSVKWSWVDHLKEWTDFSSSDIAIVESSIKKHKLTQMNEIVVTGNKEERQQQLIRQCKKNTIVIVINYDMVRTHGELLARYNWDVVILDEAHRVKNRKAKQTKASVQVCNQSKYVWSITGTPVKNNPAEIWQLLNICDPLRFSSYWNFVNYHFDTTITPYQTTQIIGLKNPNEFNSMLSNYMYRITKEEALPDLPPKIYQDIELQLNPQQYDVYKQMEEDFIIEITKQLEDGKTIQDILVAKKVVSQLIRLRQICLNPAILGSVNDSAKLDALNELIDDLNGQFILYSCFRSFIPYLEKMLQAKKISYGVIQGGQSARERMDIQEALTAGKIQAVIGTIQSMGEGMNLQAASTAIFCDIDWVPAVNKQAEDRIHRAGVKTSPVIVRLYHPGTVDADIRRTCERKERAIDSTVGQVEVIREMLLREGVSIV